VSGDDRVGSGLLQVIEAPNSAHAPAKFVESVSELLGELAFGREGDSRALGSVASNRVGAGAPTYGRLR
jgi:hypothetical protein